MDLQDKLRYVLDLFNELDREIYLFKKSTGIDCVSHCSGECCDKEDIYAIYLEFLPLAFYLYQNNLSEEVMSQIYNKKDGVCVLFLRDKGRCRFYEYRGLVCRLFGFASYRSKDMRPQIVSCRYIKSLYKRAIDSQINPVIMADYQRRLLLIDITDKIRFIHINDAIKEAIEKTELFYRFAK